MNHDPSRKPGRAVNWTDDAVAPCPTVISVQPTATSNLSVAVAPVRASVPMTVTVVVPVWPALGVRTSEVPLRVALNRAGLLSDTA